MTTDQDLRGGTKASKAILDNLGRMPYDDLLVELGPPDATNTFYTEVPGSGWRQGDPKPTLADADPAVAQAMGRCATHRLMRGAVAAALADGSPLNDGGLHPTVCNWCAYPVRELLVALGWAAHLSGHISVEYATWRGRFRSTYDRATPRQGTYLHRRWRDFFADEPTPAAAGQRRREAIQAAMYG